MSVAEQITLEDLARDPFVLASRLREEDPVAYVPALDRWLVTPHALVCEVLQDTATFTTDHPRSLIKSTFGPQMLSTDGDEQRRHRAPYAAAFRPRSVRTQLTEPVRARCAAIVAQLQPGNDLVQPAAELAISTVLDMVGLADVASTERVAHWYAGLAAALANVAGDPQVAERGRDIAAELADAMAAGGSFDVEGLTAQEAVSNTLLVLFGGIETTQSAILNAVWALAAHPGAQSLARADAAHVTGAIEEALRWEPAVLTLTRFTTEATVFHGSEIPANSIVECLLSGANRDAMPFQDPDRYDPTRANAGDHLTFGHGRHFCLGAHLARIEATAFVEALLSLSADLRFSETDPPPPQGHEFRHPPHLRLDW